VRATLEFARPTGGVPFWWGSFLPLVKKDPHHQQIFFSFPAGIFIPGGHKLTEK
jgi:hypothetical protein